MPTLRSQEVTNVMARQTLDVLALPQVQAALLLLRGAREATALGGGAGDVAPLPRALLNGVGVTPTLLTLLCERGLIREVRGGFILTQQGAEFTLPAHRAHPKQGSPGGGTKSRRPVWDQAERELRLEEAVVKRLVATATVQAAILDAFQAAGWPPEITLLKENHGSVDQANLREAARGLNRCQETRLLRFDYRRGLVGWRTLQTI
jgi:hypothetical protein